jgi:hypothetical protein
MALPQIAIGKPVVLPRIAIRKPVVLPRIAIGKPVVLPRIAIAREAVPACVFFGLKRDCLSCAFDKLNDVVTAFV